MPMITRRLAHDLPRCGLLVLAALLGQAAAVRAAELKFDFGPGEARPGYTRVTPGTAYDAKRGFGFLKGAAAPGKQSVFAVHVEEGNYDVTIRFGDPAGATATTVKAESRRLMVERVETAPGKFETRTCTVNVRKPAISTGGTTRLSAREKGPPPVPDWDEYLTLEFNGKRPGVASLEVRPARGAVTVFLAGDSTVTDQPNEPYAGWGGRCCRGSSGAAWPCRTRRSRAWRCSRSSARSGWRRS
jgi:hypothetical protein